MNNQAAAPMSEGYKHRRVSSGLYTIIHGDRLAEFVDLKRVEEVYKAKYVGEFSLKQSNGWLNCPVALFYTEEAHPEGSNYFGLLSNHEGILVVVNGITAAEYTWEGVMNPVTQEILYSAYRHDYQTYGDLMADGGAEYVRASVHPHKQFKIVKDTLVVLED